MIYFAFNGTDEELRATRIGASGDFESMEYKGMRLGILFTADPFTHRPRVDKLHPNLVTLPGAANGKLAQRHVDALKVAFPDAKVGDSMSDLLAKVYADTQHEGYNPDHH